MLFLAGAINGQTGKTVSCSASFHRINSQSTPPSCCHRQYYGATESDFMMTIMVILMTVPLTYFLVIYGSEFQAKEIWQF